MKQLPLKNKSFEYLENSFKEWLDILGYAPSTVYALPLHVRELLYTLEQKGGTSIKSLTTKHIKDYYNYLRSRTNTRIGGGLSGNHLNKHLQAIERFLDYLRQTNRHGMGMELIMPDIRREDVSRNNMEVLTKEEIKELYRCCENYNEGTGLEGLNARDKAMLTVFYGCGLRRNEGYSLDVSDVDFDRKLLYVRKGKGTSGTGYKQRLVPFNKANSRVLEHYVFDWRPKLAKDRKEEALFISQRGGRMDGQSLALRLKLLQQRTDDIILKQKQITLHGLRHSIATHLLEAGMSLENIARFLGHSSLESTQIYTRITGGSHNQESNTDE